MDGWSQRGGRYFVASSLWRLLFNGLTLHSHPSGERLWAAGDRLHSQRSNTNQYGPIRPESRTGSSSNYLSAPLPRWDGLSRRRASAEQPIFWLMITNSWRNSNFGPTRMEPEPRTSALLSHGASSCLLLLVHFLYLVCLRRLHSHWKLTAPGSTWSVPHQSSDNLSHLPKWSGLLDKIDPESEWFPWEQDVFFFFFSVRCEKTNRWGD